MIEKFKEIKNLAVFKDFKWDETVLNYDNKIKKFKKVNILYGRNYSGKTTLSRILRFMENNEISKKYKNPDFTVSFNNVSDVKASNISDHSKIIRVFNEDFVSDYLKFIIDQDGNIKPFAILGKSNKKIENKIEKLESKLGTQEEGNETGLYKELKKLEKHYKEDLNKLKKEKNKLTKKLKYKATDRNNGIKYNPEKFGDQNYNISKLKNDIDKVLDDDYQSLFDERKKELEKLIDEDTHDHIPEISKLNLNLVTYIDKTKELVEKEVVETNKIKELVNDAILNRWVKKGYQIHKKKERKICGFCGNRISNKRWEELDNHFDKKSKKLEKEIEELMEQIKYEKEEVKNAFNPDKNLFYSKYHARFENLVESYNEISDKYIKSLNILLDQLIKRKKNIIDNFSFEEPDNVTEKISSIFENYNILRQESNSFSESLEEEQIKSRKKLRLHEISDFLKTIGYSERKNKIEELENKKDDSKIKYEKLQEEIDSLVNKIQSQKRQLKDEEQGAKKVNEYLNDFFGHNSLSLQSIEDEGTNGEASIYFEIMREGEKAYNLSEGECNLISFCYFMAKLDDINTKGTKPIIWIDDPVSSLDGNHIFFIYSLIKSELINKNKFEQLFISTHNLNFLKYLKRLSKKSEYFLIERKDNFSSIKPMPKHLRKYITEYNYLFKQIYKCSKADKIDDSNYSTFYNFGNNARKFLRIYLYYKYPDYSNPMDKLKRFFGEKEIPSILTNRMCNEYSHLIGNVERGAIPIEEPEMQKVAKKIINKIKNMDKDQFDSFLKSIDEK